MVQVAAKYLKRRTRRRRLALARAALEFADAAHAERRAKTATPMRLIAGVYQEVKR